MHAFALPPGFEERRQESFGFSERLVRGLQASFAEPATDIAIEAAELSAEIAPTVHVEGAVQLPNDRLGLADQLPAFREISSLGLQTGRGDGIEGTLIEKDNELQRFGGQDFSFEVVLIGVATHYDLKILIVRIAWNEREKQVKVS